MDLPQPTQKYHVIGYINPVIYGAVKVRAVLNDPNRKDFYFFPEEPNKDVRSQVESTPAKDDKGFPLLGAPSFVLLEDPILYQEGDIYIRQPDGTLLASAE